MCFQNTFMRFQNTFMRFQNTFMCFSNAFMGFQKKRMDFGKAKIEDGKYKMGFGNQLCVSKIHFFVLETHNLFWKRIICFGNERDRQMKTKVPKNKTKQYCFVSTK